ncbi:MAG: DUF1015 domain-containing protein [Clostridia bacterium]|nr:DUF1015 domain-containing protein [Clostridia bacterium]
MKFFHPTDILLPKTNHEKWATIACDQHTSDPSYWEKADAIASEFPSALRVILPEVYLLPDNSKRIAAINQTMQEYLDSGIFTEYKDALIFLERTLPSGKVRHGLVGAVDLEAYDYHKGAKSPIRATEETVADRIPPRVAIRQNASLELPHVMLLINDMEKTVIEPLANAKNSFPLLYDFDLMLGGGHVKGYLVTKEYAEKVERALDTLYETSPLLFAVGDGNHSLATAKTCYEMNPTSLSQSALVEVVNIHDSALEFEPIYRVLFGVDPSAVLKALEDYFAKQTAKDTQEVTVIFGTHEVTLSLPAVSTLAVSTLQQFLDGYIKAHPEVTIDYIHGIRETRALAQAPNTIGFLFDGMKKEELFPAVEKDGALVRKTFSMGEAADKRYYIEARKIR